MKVYILIIILGLFIFNSCTDSPTSVEKKFHLSGKTVYNNMPVSDVLLYLKKNNEVVQETKSNTNGEFDFTGLYGQYELSFNKSFQDSSFVGNTIELNILADTTLERLLLPKPVKLYPPLEVTWTTADLTWSPFEVSDFYEYRLYRGRTTALDENTGELIHISTSALDTTFHDDLTFDGQIPGRNSKFYYRIYINNVYGQMAGSNILEVITPKWENENNFTVNYNLTQITNFQIPGGTVTGIDYDGEYLWILTLLRQNGYYDPDVLTLNKYDLTSEEVVRQFVFTDEYAESASLAFDGNNIWISLQATNNEKIEKIDTTTGNVLEQYSTRYGLHDITSDGQHLYYCYYYNNIEKRSISNLRLVEQFNNPFGSGANFGIAYRPGEIWLSSYADNQLAIIDEAGTHIGVANTDLLSDFSGMNSHLHLCFANENLIMVKDDIIYILEIQ